MNRREADALAGRLSAEHPDRETHRFVVTQDDSGVWSVAKIGLPPSPTKPLGSETRADEKPPMPDDPRDLHTRNTGGPWGGAGGF